MNKFLELVEQLKKSKEYETDATAQAIANISIEDIYDVYKKRILKLEKNLETLKQRAEELKANYDDFSLNIINKISKVKNNSATVEMIEKINKSPAILFSDIDNGKHEVKDRFLLESSINNVYETPYYRDEWQRLAVIWFRIIKNHPFHNGNKRTAMVGTKVCAIVGVMEEIYDLVIEKTNMIVTESRKKMVDDMKKTIKKLPDGRKPSKSSLKKTADYIGKVMSKVSNDTIIQFNDSLREHLLNSWVKSFEEDYVLSIFVAQNVSYDSTKEELDTIYELLELNLKIFIYINIDFIMNSTENLLNKILINIDKTHNFEGKLSAMSLLKILENNR